MTISEQIQLVLLSKEKDLKELQVVLEGAPKYSLNISGKIQTPTASEEVFSAIPEGFDLTKKFVIGIKLNSELVGCIDVLRGFPSEETLMLGLLLLKEKIQGQGIGKISFNQLLSYVGNWTEIKKIRISVVKSNGDVLNFWQKLGIVENGIRKPYENGNIKSEAIY